MGHFFGDAEQMKYNGGADFPRARLSPLAQAHPPLGNDRLDGVGQVKNLTVMNGTEGLVRLGA